MPFPPRPTRLRDVEGCGSIWFINTLESLSSLLFRISYSGSWKRSGNQDRRSFDTTLAGLGPKTEPNIDTTLSALLSLV